MAHENLIEEVVERPYKLRKLKDGDLFPLLKILRKMGIKEFKNAFTLSDGNESGDLKKVGIKVVLDMADIVIGNISGSAGEDIYAFWSDLSGIAVEDIKEMEFGTLPLMIIDTFSEVKDTSFFKVLFKLL